MATDKIRFTHNASLLFGLDTFIWIEFRWMRKPVELESTKEWIYNESFALMMFCVALLSV